MPSVMVTWRGTCRSRGAQKELVSFLRQLAERSSTLVAKRDAVRASHRREPRSGSDVPAPPVRFYDQEVVGKVLVSSELPVKRQRRSLLEKARDCGTRLVEIKSTLPFSLLSDEQEEPWVCLRLRRLHLYGLDFELYDPRGPHYEENRLSFVFLDSPDLPALRGLLAKAEDREECALYRSKVVASADWLLDAPDIHLRYYLEEWTDRLLSWVKFFFVPNLWWSRYAELSGYEGSRCKLEALCQEHGKDGAKQVAFAGLLEDFDREAEEWTRECSHLWEEPSG